MAPDLWFRCVKTNETFPFELNKYNNPSATGLEYSSLVLEGGYKVNGFHNLVPFRERHAGFDATKSPLKKIKKLEELMLLNNVYVKDESFHPYGTHKDRRSEYIVNVALEHNVDKIVCLTAGNAGYSLSRYCAKAGIDYTSLLFPWVSKQRAAELGIRGNVIYIDGLRYKGILRPRHFTQIVAEFDKYERKKEWKNIWAVTNSFDPISINAYKELVYELADDIPDYLIMPCGSGDLIIGAWLALEELGRPTIIIAVGPEKEHPLGYALQNNNDEYVIENYTENSIAEKLTSPFTAVLPILYKIFHNTRHIYIETDNDTIRKTQIALDEIDIKTETSAATAFAGLLGHERPNIPSDAKVVIVSTGKGVES